MTIMLRNLFVVAVVVLFFSCAGNTDKKEESETTKISDSIKTAKTSEAQIYSVDDIKLKKDELMGKEVSVKGTVTHICRHSGKRMHLVGGDEKFVIKVESTDISFDAAWEKEGKEITVTGVLAELSAESEAEEAEHHAEENAKAKEEGTEAVEDCDETSCLIKCTKVTVN